MWLGASTHMISFGSPALSYSSCANFGKQYLSFFPWMISNGELLKPFNKSLFAHHFQKGLNSSIHLIPRRVLGLRLFTFGIAHNSDVDFVPWRSDMSGSCIFNIWLWHLLSDRFDTNMIRRLTESNIITT